MQAWERGTRCSRASRKPAKSAPAPSSSSRLTQRSTLCTPTALRPSGALRWSDSLVEPASVSRAQWIDFALYVAASLLFRQLASLVERHEWNWPQGDTETIAGVTPFPLANQRALRNQIRQVPRGRRW